VICIGEGARTFIVVGIDSDHRISCMGVITSAPGLPAWAYIPYGTSHFPIPGVKSVELALLSRLCFWQTLNGLIIIL
jgi:hypothetical protein